jgi:hypothetical protein
VEEWFEGQQQVGGRLRAVMALDSIYKEKISVPMLSKENDGNEKYT